MDNKLRTEGVINGVAIGLGIGFLGMAGITHFFGKEILDIADLANLPPPPTTTGLVFVLTIAGVVLLALGIGVEAYQRAKGQSNPSKEE